MRRLGKPNRGLLNPVVRSIPGSKTLDALFKGRPRLIVEIGDQIVDIRVGIEHIAGLQGQHLQIFLPSDGFSSAASSTW